MIGRRGERRRESEDMGNVEMGRGKRVRWEWRSGI